MPKIKIIDTTLRDGEQSAGLSFNMKEKIEIAKALDKAGIYQIEAGTPAMGGLEKKSIFQIASLGLKARIATWNRMVVTDVREAMTCGNVIIHISVPSSDLHIKKKLNKSRAWVLDDMERCIYTAKEKEFDVTIGLEDASRADSTFIAEVASKASQCGVTMIRFADTTGILNKRKTYEAVNFLKNTASCEVGMHAHNDLGMAVANSITAVLAGASFVDTTIGGIGERAGNCHFFRFIEAAKACMLDISYVQQDTLKEADAFILNIIRRKPLHLPLSP